MRPKPRRFISGSTARVVWKAADRLIARIASHLFRRELLDRRDVLDAGVVHQDVDRPEASTDAFHHVADGRRIGHVGGVEAHRHVVRSPSTWQSVFDLDGLPQGR